MNDTKAVISTAHATWALFYATDVLAILTLAVVVVAVGVPLWQRKRDQSDARRLRKDVEDAAEDAVQRTFSLVQEISNDLEMDVSFDLVALWSYANRLHSQRRVVEHFLSRGTISTELPYRLSAAIQSIDESADGVKQAADERVPNLPVHKAAARKYGHTTVELALERLRVALFTTV